MPGAGGGAPITTWFDGRATHLPPKRGSVEERHRARLTMARNASGPDDLRELLDLAGLWPAQDADAITESTSTPIVWGADYIARRINMT